jgi:hypothetical protein
LITLAWKPTRNESAVADTAGFGESATELVILK